MFVTRIVLYHIVPYRLSDIRGGATVTKQFALANKGYQDFVVEDHELS